MGSCSHWERQNKRQAFWDEMAAKYPLPFDKKSLADTSRIIELVVGRGVKIDGACILDIGCGTGVYSLPLARRADRVVGLDSSENMLARFEKVKRDNNIDNASTVCANWTDADIADLGFKKCFDIVWASMTPAVRDDNDLLRMMRCAKQWCVYIGWGGKRRNPLLEEVFAAHGLVFGPPPGAGAVQAILKRQGIETQMNLVETVWEWQGTIAEACSHAAGFVEVMDNIAPDKKRIQEIIIRFSDGEEVRHQTEVEMGVITWRID
jgi:SAM-dependent methyltransferase